MTSVSRRGSPPSAVLVCFCLLTVTARRACADDGDNDSDDEFLLLGVRELLYAALILALCVLGCLLACLRTAYLALVVAARDFLAYDLGLRCLGPAATAAGSVIGDAMDHGHSGSPQRSKSCAMVVSTIWLGVATYIAQDTVAIWPREDYFHSLNYTTCAECDTCKTNCDCHENRCPGSEPGKLCHVSPGQPPPGCDCIQPSDECGKYICDPCSDVCDKCESSPVNVVACGEAQYFLASITCLSVSATLVLPLALAMLILPLVYCTVNLCANARAPAPSPYILAKTSYVATHPPPIRCRFKNCFFFNFKS